MALEQGGIELKLKGFANFVANLQKATSQTDIFDKAIDKTVAQLEQFERAINFRQPANLSQLAAGVNDLATATRKFSSGKAGAILGKTLNEVAQGMARLRGVFAKGGIEGIATLTRQLSQIASPLASFASAMRQFTTGKQIALFPQRMRDIGAAFATLRAQLAGTDLASFGSQLNSIAVPLVNFAKAVRTFTASASLKDIGPRIGAIINALDQLEKAKFDAIARKLASIAQPLRDFAVALRAINRVKLDNSFVQKLNGYTKTLKKFQKNIKTVQKFVKAFQNVFGAPLKKAIDLANGALQRLAQGVLAVLNPFKALRSALTAMLGTLKSFVSSLKGVVPAFSKIKKSVPNKEFNTFNVAMKSGIGGVRDFLTGILGLAGGFLLLHSAVRTFGVLFKSAFNATASFESLQASLKALSAREIARETDTDLQDNLEAANEKAQVLLGSIQQLAFTSPFNVEGINQIFRQGLAYGFTSDQALGLTQTLIDFTAATGQSIEVGNGILTALAQMSANTKVAKEELNQLAERGVPAIQILSEAFGVTTKELLDMVSDGLVPADAAIGAIVESLQKDFAGQALAQNQTLKGLTSSLQDIFEIASRSLFGPMFDAAKPFLALLVTIGQSTEFRDWLADLGERVSVRAVAAFNFLALAAGNLWQIFQVGRATLAATVTDFQTLFTTFTGFSTMSEFVASMVTKVTELIGKMHDNVTETVASMLQYLADSSAEFFDWGVGLISAFADGILKAVSIVIDALAFLGNAIAEWLAPGSPPKLLPNIDQWGTAAANEFLGGFTSADFSLIDKFGGSISTLFDALRIEEFDSAGLTQSVAQAIADIDMSGSIADETMEKLSMQTANVDENLSLMVGNYLTLAEQQRALNEVTAEYENLINGAAAALDLVENKQTFAEEERQLNNLNRALQNRFLTSVQRSDIESKIQKIVATRRVRDLQIEQKQREALVNQTQEDIKALEQRAKLAGEASSEDGTPGSSASLKSLKKDDKEDGIGGALTDRFKSLSDIIKNLKLDDIELPSLADSLGDPESIFAPLIQQFESGKLAIDEKVTAINETFKKMGIGATQVRVGLAILGAVLIGPKVLGAFTTFAKVIRGLKLGGIFAPLLSAAGSLALPLLLAAAGITAFGLAWENGMVDIDPALLTAIKDKFKEVQEVIDEVIAGDTSFTDAVVKLLEIDLEPIEAAANQTYLDVKAKVKKAFADKLPDIFKSDDEDTDFGQQLADGVSLVNLPGGLETKIKELDFTAFREGLVSALLGGLTELTIAGVANSFNTFATSLDSGLLDSLTNLGIQLAFAVTELLKLSGQILGAAGAFLVWSGILELAIDLVAVVLNFIGNLAQSIFNANIALANLDLGAYFSSLGNFFSSFAKLMLDILNAIAEIFGFSFNDVFAGFLKAGESLNTFFNSLPGIAARAIVSITTWFFNLGVKFGTFISKMKVNFGQVPKFLATAFGPLRTIMGLVRLIGGVFKSIPAIVSETVALIRTSVTTFGTNTLLTFLGIKTAVVGFFMALPATFTGLWESAKTEVTTFRDSVKKSFTNITTNVGLKLTGLKTKATTAFTGVVDSVTAGAEAIKTKFDDVSTKATEIVIAAIEDPFGTAVEGADALLTKFTNIGSESLLLVSNITGLDIPDPFPTIKEAGDAVLALVEDLFPAFVQFKDDVLAIDFGDPTAALTTLLDAFVKLVNGLITPFNTFKTKLAEIVFSVPGLETLKTLIGDIKSAASSLITPFQTFATDLGNLEFPDITGFLPDISLSDLNPFSSAGNDVADSFEDTAQGRVNETTLTLPDDIVDSSGAVTAANQTGEDIAKGTEEGFLNGVTSLGTSMAEGAATAWGSMTGFFQTESPSVLAKDTVGIQIPAGIALGVEEGMATVTEALGAMSESMLGNLTTLLENIKTLFTGDSFLTAANFSYSEFFISVLGQTTEWASNVGITVKDLATGFIGFINDLIKTVTDNNEDFIDDYNDITEEWAEFIQDLVKAMVDFFIAQVLRMSIEVIRILEALVISTTNIMKRFVDAVKNAAKKAVEGFSTEFGKIVTEADKILKDLAAVFVAAGAPGGSLYDAAVELGKQVVLGMEKGIKDNTFRLRTAVRELALELIEELKQNLEIASPSRVAMKIMDFFVQGAEIGLVSGVGRVLSASRQLSDSIIDGFSAASGSKAMTAGSTMTGSLASGMLSNMRPLDMATQRINQRLMSGLGNGLGSKLTAELNGSMGNVNLPGVAVPNMSNRAERQMRRHLGAVSSSRGNGGRIMMAGASTTVSSIHNETKTLHLHQTVGASEQYRVKRNFRTLANKRI